MPPKALCEEGDRAERRGSEPGWVQPPPGFPAEWTKLRLDCFAVQNRTFKTFQKRGFAAHQQRPKY